MDHQSISPAGSEHQSEQVLRKAVQGLSPKNRLQEAIKSKVLTRIEHPQVFAQVRDALSAEAGTQETVWKRIKQSIGDHATSSLLDRVRGILTPSTEQAALWHRVLERISMPERSWTLTPVLRYAATFVLFAFVVRMSPVLFAPPIAAKTDVELRPSHDVSVLIGGLFQPVNDAVTLERSALIQTGADGGATIILHDAAVLRLGPSTTLALHDVSDRPSTKYAPSMTLYRGKLWVQAFLGGRNQPLTVGSEQGIVQVKEGSVALVQGGDEESVGTDIRVWNRSATIVRTGETITLFAGDRVSLQTDETAFVTKMPHAIDDAWTKANLASDLVHQKEIARLQQQRLASQAGFLPNSAMYPVKRLAEQVDVLMTIGSEAKAEKLLQQAETRLSEAAALLEQGSVQDAQASLAEYKQTIQEVAAGSGGTLVQSLVAERAAQVSESLSAALPDDGVYAVKEAVLETTTTFPSEDETADAYDVERELLADQVAALVRKVGEAADVRELRREEQRLTQAVATLREESKGIPVTFFEEARTTLIRIDSEITAIEARLNIITTGSTLPISQKELTDAQVDSYVSRVLGPLGTVSQLRTKRNELHISLMALRGHPDAGRILRRLKKSLQPELQHYVDLEIGLLNNQIEGTTVHQAAPEEPETIE